MSSVFGPLALVQSSLRRLARRLPPALGKAPEAQPQVSVLVPVFNHAPYLGEALESALGQSLRPHEVLCLDDGSTDDSLAVAQRFARDYPEVRVEHRANRGAHATLNELLGEARAPLVAILNSDDVWHPARLERCAAALGPAHAAVSTGLVTIGPDGAPAANPWLDDALAWHALHGDLAAGLCYGNFVSTTSNLLARREALLRLGGFDALRYTHDQELLLRLCSSGEGLRLLEARLLAYRVHPANTIKERPGEVRAEWAAVLAAHARKAGRSAAFDAAVAARGLGEEVAAAALVLESLPADARASAVLARRGAPQP